VDFRFVPPDLRDLDLATAELLACCMWSDVRPVRGTAGLLDFRLAGRLSGLSRDRFLGGGRGEVLCLPGRPRLPFEKVLVFGLGERASFSDLAYEEAVKHIARTLEGLQVARAVVELPGRADGAVSAERAAELLLPVIGSEVHDTWWLVEGPEAQRAMDPRLQRDRRGLRRG
jgi:leucyl aminopeptidase